MLEEILDRLGLGQYYPESENVGDEETRSRDKETWYQLFLLHPSDPDHLERLAQAALSSAPILLSTERMLPDDIGRLRDYCRGLCDGLHLQMEQVTDAVYLLSPSTVSVSGLS